MTVRFGGTAARAAAGVLALALALACGERERQFDAARAFGHLEEQMRQGPRVPGSEAHRRTFALLHDHLRERADRVTVHRFVAVSPLDSSEVELSSLVAVFAEDAPVRLLFGAHWDSRPICDRETDEELRRLAVPGANDGASGVAVLLEVATALAADPPRVGVDLAFFDGEDMGREGDPRSYALGSARFVRDFPKYRPALVVILDMVGRRGLRIPREPNSVLGAARAVERIWSLGREIGCSVLADSLGPPIMDDHVPFLEVGIPAVDLIDLADPAWHTRRDVAENCAPESLGEVGKLVLAIIREAEHSL
jgi:glutaminyl-peptide cyclotransferase